MARRTALVYLLVAGLWILLSDRAVALFTTDPHLIEQLSIGKGWFFVIVTAGLLYVGLRKQLMQGEAEVAARQRATEALQEVEERQRLFIEYAPAALAMFDREMRYLAVSRRWLDDYRLGPRNLLGLSHYEVFPEISEEWKAIHRRALVGDVIRAEADLFTRADGSVHWLRWEVRPWHRAAGSVGGIVAFSEDITARVVAERALKESQDRFRELAEAVNEVFWITDPGKKQVLYVSPAYERIWGRSCASLYTAPTTWADAIQSEDRARVLEAAATRQVTGEYNETYRIERPDGQVRWIQDRAYPVRDAAGTVLRVVGVAVDITEKKRIEAQFLRAQRLEAVGALAGGVAHDLNNILTPVLMAAGVLRDEAKEDHEQELITMIEVSARRGADIIRQLLAFSRGVEGERIVLQPRHLLKEMAAIVRETFPREISLHEEIAKDLWPVEADATQLHQVLMNLCVNARDAMPRGGRLALMASNLQLHPGGPPVAGECRPGPYVLLEVVDTGEGMAPETVARIFEPFFTTKGLGKGTGLGLSTVLGIVRSHGGHVSVYSEPGNGSRFKVYLPAKPDGETPPAAPSVATERGQGELVLVVDDEETIREATRRLLESQGYQVLTAADGQAALSLVLLHRDRLRLVLTDVMMPVMGGVALARALRTLDTGIPVVATSGLDEDNKRQELTAVGVQEVLAKPCAAEQLLAVIRGAIQGAVGDALVGRVADPVVTSPNPSPLL